MTEPVRTGKERGEAIRRRKQLALIAHDNRKVDLLDWARFNRETLLKHDLHATGTTGALIADELGLTVNRCLSGPLGGDQQVGAAIAEGRIDAVIFFWDPLEPHPHDVDVKALANRRRLQHRHRLQQGDRRLRSLKSSDGRRVRANIRVASKAA